MSKASLTHTHHSTWKKLPHLNTAYHIIPNTPQIGKHHSRWHHTRTQHNTPYLYTTQLNKKDGQKDSRDFSQNHTRPLNIQHVSVSVCYGYCDRHHSATTFRSFASINTDTVCCFYSVFVDNSDPECYVVIFYLF